MEQFVYFPEQASTHAQHVDLLYYGLIVVCGFFVVAITFLVVFFAVKYRRRPGNEIATETPEYAFLEIGWSVLPLVIGLFLFAWGTHVFLTLYSPPGGDAMHIFAVGKQWMWKFQHPKGRREINDLHVPMGVPIQMTMISQDVIHSFYVPAFRVKQDVVPGRYSTTWFEATKPGTYHLFCAEYCGAEHSRMAGKVIVLSPSDYQKWLESPLVEGDETPRTADRMAKGPTLAAPLVTGNVGSGASLADKGKALLESQGCRACHRMDNEALAPKLEGIFGTDQPLADGSTVKVTPDYIRDSVRNPQGKVVKGFMPVMPVYGPELLNEEQLNQIIEYVKSTSGSMR